MENGLLFVVMNRISDKTIFLSFSFGLFVAFTVIPVYVGTASLCLAAAAAVFGCAAGCKEFFLFFFRQDRSSSDRVNSDQRWGAESWILMCAANDTSSICVYEREGERELVVR